MPFSGGMIASYLLVKGLGMLKTRWEVIIPTCMSTFNLIMMRTSLSTVPESLIESAKLDGANEFTIIFRVLIPLVKATPLRYFSLLPYENRAVCSRRPVFAKRNCKNMNLYLETGKNIW